MGSAMSRGTESLSPPEFSQEVVLRRDPAPSSQKLATFFKAVEDNDVELVEVMLTEEHIDVNAKNDEANDTALHIAAYNGNFNMVQKLVEKYGANINETNKYNEVPLEIAKDKYHAKICKFLVLKNSNKAECAQSLLNSEEVDALFNAAKTNSIEDICQLIEKGIDVNSTDKGDYSRTPLHVSAKYGYEELAKILIYKYKAVVDITDDIGDRPIHLAAQHGHIPIVEFLMERKSKGSKDVAKFLNEKNSIGNCQDVLD